METLVTLCIIALVLLLLYVLTRARPQDAISIPDAGGPSIDWSFDGGSGSCSSGGDGGGGDCGGG
jgi:hypothetical protein